MALREMARRGGPERETNIMPAPLKYRALRVKPAFSGRLAPRSATGVPPSLAVQPQRRL
ncbi:hypothetical protein [Erwinia oleae]|uniref:hypothetical protein n=1 Tax=Erwinia oleae TaxID=796334 RepID=UPI00136225AC|nr:hypothetical protein [Erwinia oleae]